ncbi:MAG: carboxypeptidase-like regulatory domain-containing protein [Terracidiphilus sp.]
MNVVCGRAAAQIAGTGNIQGTVSDSTGAVMPQAAVTLIDEATRVARKTTSDSAGVYVFPGVPVGKYDLSVSASGFETYQQIGIVLEVGSSIAVNTALRIGTAATRACY